MLDAAPVPFDASSPHYYFVTVGSQQYECIDVIEYIDLGYHLGNALKYLWRAGVKTGDPTDDLRKAQNYMERWYRLSVAKKRQHESAAFIISYALAYFTSELERGSFEPHMHFSTVQRAATQLLKLRQAYSGTRECELHSCSNTFVPKQYNHKYCSTECRLEAKTIARTLHSTSLIGTQK